MRVVMVLRYNAQLFFPAGAGLTMASFAQSAHPDDVVMFVAPARDCQPNFLHVRSTI